MIRTTPPTPSYPFVTLFLHPLLSLLLWLLPLPRVFHSLFTSNVPICASSEKNAPEEKSAAASVAPAVAIEVLVVVWMGVGVSVGVVAAAEG